MTAKRVKGYITEDGEIRANLPDNWLPGEIAIEVQIADAGDDGVVIDFNTPWASLPWTEEELAESFDFQPSTLGEILREGLLGGWEDRGITDSVEWVKEQRRKSRERRGLNWTL